MRTISQLSAEANSYEFSIHISFASWLHVCRTLLRESQVYDAEGADLERAYILYLRYADLVLNKLPKHPKYGTNKQMYNKMLSQVPVAIERSEALKQKIQQQRQQRLNAARKSVSVDHNSEEAERAPSSSISPDTFESELEKYANDGIEVPEIDLNSLIIDKHRGSKPQTSAFRPPSRAATPKIPVYPSLPSHSISAELAANTSYNYQTGRPSDNAMSSSQGASPPSYEQATSGHSPSPEEQIHKPPQLDIKSVYKTERGEPLRTVFIPSQLRSKFLAIAAPNTKANLETCGMLCGKLRRNAFFVTDLLIPHQESTSDSCATTNEEELFEYVDSRDLFLVGWIHTHPTQTCFMSSVDLHTHASYQIMLPEAIAIVCAPSSTPDWGAFRLTDPPGIDVIKSCKLTGFHQHNPNTNLYRKGGHYREIQFELVAEDLRKR